MGKKKNGRSSLSSHKVGKRRRIRMKEIIEMNLYIYIYYNYNHKHKIIKK